MNNSAAGESGQIVIRKLFATSLFLIAAWVYAEGLTSSAAAEVTFAVTLPASEPGPITGRLIVVRRRKTPRATAGVRAQRSASFGITSRA